MKMLNNKKGDAYTWMWTAMGWALILLPAIIITAIIMISFFANFTNAALFTTEETYTTIYLHRFIDSPNCFAHQDPFTGRAMPGVIDEDKYTEEVLQRCSNADPTDMALLLQLDISDPRSKIAKKTIQTANFRQLGKKYPGTFVWIMQDDGTMLKGRLLVGVGI